MIGIIVTFRGRLTVISYESNIFAKCFLQVPRKKSQGKSKLTRVIEHCLNVWHDGVK